MWATVTALDGTSSPASGISPSAPPSIILFMSAAVFTVKAYGIAIDRPMPV